jgi:hypothetical protein
MEETTETFSIGVSIEKTMAGVFLDRLQKWDHISEKVTKYQ